MALHIIQDLVVCIRRCSVHVFGKDVSRQQATYVKCRVNPNAHYNNPAGSLKTRFVRLKQFSCKFFGMTKCKLAKHCELRLQVVSKPAHSLLTLPSTMLLAFCTLNVIAWGIEK